MLDVVSVGEICDPGNEPSSRLDAEIATSEISRCDSSVIFPFSSPEGTRRISGTLTRS